MSDRKDIEDVAPAGGGGDRPDFSKREDLAGIPLELRDYKGPFTGEYGGFFIFEGVRLDTGDEIAFTGATVLNQQGQKCKDGGHFPVTAMLEKQRGAKHEFWVFVSPEKAPF